MRLGRSGDFSRGNNGGVKPIGYGRVFQAAVVPCQVAYRKRTGADIRTRSPLKPGVGLRSLDLLGISVRAAQFLACPEQLSSAKLSNGPRNCLNLSGAVRQVDKAFPPLVRVFVPCILTRSRPVPASRLRSGENCSTPSPPDVRTIQPSPDCDGCSEAFPQSAGNFEC